MYREEVQETITGTPQGGIVSPLLANIYLHELDMYMESKYLNLSDWHRYKRRKQGECNYLYARYADDFVVLCNGTKAQALAMKEELKEVLNQMGLKLSEEKTKVTHITEGFTFLGFWITRSMGQGGKMVPKVLIPDSAIKRFQHATRRILAPGTTNEATAAKIIAVNQLVRGWCQYYRCTSSPSYGFGILSHELIWDMTHWLGKKYKISAPTVLRRYRRTGGKDYQTLGTERISMELPNMYKAKRLIGKTWHNPYTAKEAIIREKFIWYESLWSGTQNRTRRMGRPTRRNDPSQRNSMCNPRPRVSKPRKATPSKRSRNGSHYTPRKVQRPNGGRSHGQPPTRMYSMPQSKDQD